MRRQNSPPIEPPSMFGMGLVAGLLVLVLWSVALADETGKGNGTPAGAPNPEVAPRGQRAAIRDINYGAWQKVCFKPGGASMVCRTSISGSWDTGQIAVRADLIEREGADAARLQLFLPVGLYLPPGVKVTVDQGSVYHIPYNWCLTNTCIAGQVADPKLIDEIEMGQKLVLEVVDSNLTSVSTTLPLAQFAITRKNAPAQIFEQDIDE
jgi:invasion protein IalB